MPRRKKTPVVPAATQVGVQYTTDEVAVLLKTTRRTVQRWIREGKLKAVTAGSQYRIRQDQLDAFQRQQGQE